MRLFLMSAIVALGFAFGGSAPAATGNLGAGLGEAAKSTMLIEQVQVRRCRSVRICRSSPFGRRCHLERVCRY